MPALAGRAGQGWGGELAAVLLGLLAGQSAAEPSGLRPGSIWTTGRPKGHVEVSDELPSPSVFFHEYVRKERPLLLRGAATHMPAHSLWTDDYLRERYGSVAMDQVETEKKETRTAYPKEDWTLSKFLDHYNTSTIYSTATTPKGLSNEVYLLPSINCGGFHKRMSASVLWFSSGGTKSVIHQDAQDNLHCMFAGEKHWMLWHPDSGIDTPAMGWVHAEEEAKKDPAFKDAYGAYVGRLDVDAVDLQRFPGWAKLEWWNMTLSAGDCAYIPRSWFHYVEAPPQRSISVHVWFHSRKTFDLKSCQAIQSRGYNLSGFMARLSDCTWGFGEEGSREPTRCKLHKSLPGPGSPQAARGKAERQSEL